MTWNLTVFFRKTSSHIPVAVAAPDICLWLQIGQASPHFLYSSQVFVLWLLHAPSATGYLHIQLPLAGMWVLQKLLYLQIIPLWSSRSDWPGVICLIFCSLVQARGFFLVIDFHLTMSFFFQSSYIMSCLYIHWWDCSFNAGVLSLTVNFTRAGAVLDLLTIISSTVPDTLFMLSIICNKWINKWENAYCLLLGFPLQTTDRLASLAQKLLVLSSWVYLQNLSKKTSSRMPHYRYGTYCSDPASANKILSCYTDALLPTL